MTHARHWLPIFLAGCVWTQASAQTTGSPGTTTSGGAAGTSGETEPTASDGLPVRSTPTTRPASGSTTSGSTPGGATPTSPGGTAPFTPGGTTPPPSDPFGFGEPLAPVGPLLPLGPSSNPGASSNFGREPRNAAPAPAATEATSPTGPSARAAEPPSYTAPSFYGAARQVVTPGQGRFARPRYRYGVSFAIGFDDNTQQTPDNSEDIPAQTVEQVIPAQPEIAVFQTVDATTGKPFPLGGAFRGPNARTVQRKVVLRPAVPEQVVEVEIPGVDVAERNASMVSRLDLNMDVQFANSRSVFTMDLRAGAEYYWNRDKDPLEYNGSFASSYLKKLSSRMTFTGNAGITYQSQPDFSQVNLVNTPGSGGSYVVGNLKLDLSYRWAPRFSTVTSLTGSSILYQGDRSTSNYWEAGLGNEFRYIQSRKTTWILETRYSHFQYLEAALGSIDSVFLLLGSDWTVSRKLRTTVRLGEALRQFETGGNAASPYGELAVVYQPNRRDQVTVTGRYGFEQTGTASDENIAARLTASYNHTFSPRLVGSLNGNYVNSQITSGETASNNTIFDGGLSLQYTFSRKFSLNARYSYTLSKTSAGFSDYDRSRFFLTGKYDF